MKNKLKKWYESNLWSISMIADAVKKQLITKEEYKEITGEDFIEE